MTSPNPPAEDKTEWVVAPREPTIKMYKSGNVYGATTLGDLMKSAPKDGLGIIDAMTVWSYKAMLAALPDSGMVPIPDDPAAIRADEGDAK